MGTEQWADALHEWLGITEDKFFIIRTGRDAHVLKMHRFPYHFLIISYDFVSKFKEDLANLSFRLVVLDECHYIKSSKVYHAAKRPFGQVKQCWTLFTAL